MLTASLLLHTLSMASVSAFQPSVPLVRPLTRGRRHPGHTFVRTPSPLQAVAEFEELQRENKNDDNNSSNNDDDDNDWIETPSGGFLPRLFRRHPNDAAPAELMTQVVTLQDYKRVVADDHDNLVVVLFFAPWCRACKATQPLYRKLAREYSTTGSTAASSTEKALAAVKFVKVPLTQTNGFLHDGLGVPSLPYAHIYHPTAGLVEERKLNKHVFAEFRSVLETYVRGECDIDWNGAGVIRNDEPRANRHHEDEFKDEEPSLS